MSFVDEVWAKEDHSKAYCFLSQKKEGVWNDYPELLKGERAIPEDKRELYFSPVLFSQPQRRKENALDSRWLYADLDSIHPDSFDSRLRPSAFWQTSEGRWQALWFLTKPLNSDSHAKLNQRLTYWLDADKGGWSVTKVLRVPGSISIKHGGEWAIDVPDLSDPAMFSPTLIWNIVRSAPVDVVTVSGSVDLGTTKRAHEIFKSLSPRTRALIRAKSSEDRSRHCYRTAMQLRDDGLSRDDAATVMLMSHLGKEKYAARWRDHVPHLVAKAYSKQGKGSLSTRHKKRFERSDKGDELEAKLTFESLDSFMAKSFKPPRWLIDRVWSEDAHGLIAGEHKTYKSMLAMDLAVSVASGTKFLDHFDVPTQGPVLYVQQENQEGFVKDRLQKVLVSRDLAPVVKLNGRIIQTSGPVLPLYLMNLQGVDLTNIEHIKFLYRTVKKKGIQLMILDPLYLMMPGVDENSAVGMTPILKALLLFKQRLNCGVLVLHHYKKQDRDNPMFADDSRVAGSSTMMRWYESMLLIERGSQVGEIKLVPKHRMEAPSAGVTVTFDMGRVGEDYYSVMVEEAGEEEADMYAQIRKVLKEATGQMTIAQLARDLDMRGAMVKRRLLNMNDVVIKRATGRKSPVIELREKKG